MKKKQSLFDELVDDVSLDLDLSRRLNATELFGLVGLEAPPMDEPETPLASVGIFDCAKALLRDQGWAFREIQTAGRWLDLDASQADELGIEQRLLVHYFDGPGPLAAAAVMDRLSEPAIDARRVFLVPGDVDSEVLALITAAGAAAWLESDLKRQHIRA